LNKKILKNIFEVKNPDQRSGILLSLLQEGRCPSRTAEDITLIEQKMETMKNQKKHETKIRIRYKDTDRMGVVYYGNYLTFFEVARAEFMRDLGLPYSQMESEGFSLAVIEAVAKYHANVGYDSVVTVETLLSAPGKVRIRFDYRVLDEEGKLLVDGHTMHACIDENMKPTRIPPHLKKVVQENIST
jgi:acyl-CoA thioester hydrolase